MKILDNITNTVRDDLRVEIKKGSRVSIAAACFSMYAYKELKKQLETIDEFEFIFTSPTFVKEKAEKQKREFYIPRISRETSLYGTEFEIKLRNEMTQRAIAKECADWIRRKATFKSNTTGENMAGFMTVDSGAAQTAYMPIGGFTTVDIGCERGNNSYNMVNCMEAPFAQQYMKLFDTLWNDRDKMQDVTDVVLENISTAYAENSPEFIYFMTLYHITYDTIEGSYDSSIFTAEKHGLTMDKAYPAKKAIQDYVFTDGSAEKSVERKFAESLDGADEVFIYAKLPRGFFIPTPVGHYSPDWAIVFHEGAVRHIYFVAETKGTMESLNLRPIEKSKIDCAKKLFAKLSDGLVTYDHVDSYQELMNKVLQ